MGAFHAAVDLGLRLIRRARLSENPKSFIVQAFGTFHIGLWQGWLRRLDDHHLLLSELGEEPLGSASSVLLRSAFPAPEHPILGEHQ